MELELKIAEAYFAKQRDLGRYEPKYSRRDSGLSASYIQDSAGHITRLANKSELDRITGEGAFARVKKSKSHTQDTVTKIQTVPIDIDDDLSAELSHHDRKLEASINLDMGIAKGPLIIRRILSDDGRQYYKYYQEMYVMKQTLKERIPTLGLQERLEAAIDLLLVINDCHNGSSKSGTGYIHGDISSANIMYDQQGKMHLIDFGMAEKINPKRQLQEDHKSLMRTLFHPDSPYEHTALFDESQWQVLPDFIRNIFSWNNFTQLNITPDQYLVFAASVLISYQTNPHLTESAINNLKENPYSQYLIVEQYRREKTISQLPEETAEIVLEHIVQTLKRYNRFLNIACSTETQGLLVQKKEIIANILYIISHNKHISTDELLTKIDLELRIHDSVLSRGSNYKLGGVLGYITSKIDNLVWGTKNSSKIKLDSQFKTTMDRSREILQNYRAKTATPSLNSDSEDENPSVKTKP